MANVLDDNGMGGSGQRPTFLTVLCILTFVGSPLTLIGDVMNYLAYANGGPMMEAALEMLAAMGISINPIGYLIDAGLALGSLFGALQMWKLKKQGYFIYVGACVGSLVVMFIFLGGLSMGGLAVVGIALAAVFPILYGLNLKHMA